MANVTHVHLMRFITCLLLVFAVALSGCKSTSKADKEKKAALDKKAKANLREESTDTDFQAFVGRLRKAVAAHDMNTLASSNHTLRFSILLSSALAAALVSAAATVRAQVAATTSASTGAHVNRHDTFFLSAPDAEDGGPATPEDNLVHATLQARQCCVSFEQVQNLR